MTVPVDRGSRQPPPPPRPARAARTGPIKRYTIGMPDNQLFERFVVGGVDRNSEFRFVTDACDYVGFITALDDTHVKIAASDDIRAILLQRSKIVAIEETGRKLSELPYEQQVAIREYSAVFNRIVARETARDE